MANQVIIPRLSELRRKLTVLRSGGAGELQVVLDFDHTMSRFVLPSGAAAPMCHDVIEKSHLMPDSFHAGYRQLWDRQHLALSKGEWNWADWWRCSHDLMVEHGLRREWIGEMVSDAGLTLRDGCDSLSSLLSRHSIPATVVSAGLDGIIRHALVGSGFSDVPILANTMAFDEHGLLQSVTDPPLHSHDKASVGHRFADHFSKLARKHVVMLGDSITDCDCLKNIPGIQETLLVGFFNKHRGTARSEFEHVFDIVLTNEALGPHEDLTLDGVRALLYGVLTPTTPAPDEDVEHIVRSLCECSWREASAVTVD